LFNEKVPAHTFHNQQRPYNCSDKNDPKEKNGCIKSLQMKFDTIIDSGSTPNKEEEATPNDVLISITEAKNTTID
jgi:hypothetical protein